MHLIKKISQDIDNFFHVKWGALKGLLIKSISIGNAVLKLVADPTVEGLFDTIISPAVVTLGEGIVKQAIIALTEADIIINQPDEKSMLVALANYVRTLPATAHHMWVSKLVALIVKFADGQQLPENVYDLLTQHMYSKQKITE